MCSVPKPLVALAVVIAATGAHPARADTFYVDPSGNDGTGNGSAPSPWASLSHACGQVATGTHTIHLNPGVYTDDAPCDLALGVSIEGAGHDQVTIQSSYSDWYISAVSSTPTEGNHTLSGFTLDGNGRTLEHGMRFWRRHNIHVHDCRFAAIRDRAIDVMGEFTDWDPPPHRISGVHIHDIEIEACASHFAADNSSGAIHLNATVGTELSHVTCDESTTTGQCLKGVFGWNEALRVHDSVFTVGPQGATNGCVIELWGHSNDSAIHHNEFNNGFVSLVAGDKGAGTWALSFHHNVLNNTMANECSVDDLHVHDNVLTGAVPFNQAPACWNCFGFWATWITSADELSNIVVDHNIIMGATNAAIWLNDGVDYRDVRILNNTVDGTLLDGWVGSAIGLNATGNSWLDVDIANNLLLNSDGYGVWTASETPGNMAGIQVRNNLLYGNASGDFAFTGAVGFTVTDNLNEAPDLVGTGDKPRPYYEPASETANIVDQGVDVGLPFHGNAPDIGAIEWGEPDEPDAGAGGDGPAGGGPAGGGGTGGSAGAAGLPSQKAGGDSGCGCTVHPPRPFWSLGWGLVGLALWRLRRSRGPAWRGSSGPRDRGRAPCRRSDAPPR